MGSSPFLLFSVLSICGRNREISSFQIPGIGWMNCWEVVRILITQPRERERWVGGRLHPIFKLTFLLCGVKPITVYETKPNFLIHISQNPSNSSEFNWTHPNPNQTCTPVPSSPTKRRHWSDDKIVCLGWHYHLWILQQELSGGRGRCRFPRPFLDPVRALVFTDIIIMDIVTKLPSWPSASSSRPSWS